MSLAESPILRAGKNIVVGAIDDNMIFPVLIWSFSLHTRASTPPHIVIGFLDGYLSEGNRTTLARALTFLQVSHEFLELHSDARFISQGHVSSTTFAKFLLADEFEELHVWIDVDTVATKGWDRIFDLIAQSSEETRLVVAERSNRPSENRKKSKKPSDLAFNAGVLGWPAQTRLPWSDQLDNADLQVTQEQFLFNLLYGSHLWQIPETFNTLSYRKDHFREGALPYIVHFAGAHKPWHLPRRFSAVCSSYRCPWSIWFDAEKEMLKSMRNSPLSEEIEELKNQALTSGAIRKSREYSGRILLKALGILGVMGWAIVFAAKPFSRWIPRGTHPLH